MKKTFLFLNMPRSTPLEQHASEKLEKIKVFFSNSDEKNPFHAEVRITAHKPQLHYQVELHLKTPRFDLNANDEGADAYVLVDNTIDKVISLLKKEKEKLKDQRQKKETEKSKFTSDKYKL